MTTTTLTRQPRTVFGQSVHDRQDAEQSAHDQALQALFADIDALFDDVPLTEPQADVIDISTRRRALHTGDAA